VRSVEPEGFELVPRRLETVSRRFQVWCPGKGKREEKNPMRQ